MINNDFLKRLAQHSKIPDNSPQEYVVYAGQGALIWHKDRSVSAPAGTTVYKTIWGARKYRRHICKVFFYPQEETFWGKMLISGVELGVLAELTAATLLKDV